MSRVFLRQFLTHHGKIDNDIIMNGKTLTPDTAHLSFLDDLTQLLALLVPAKTRKKTPAV